MTLDLILYSVTWLIRIPGSYLDGRVGRGSMTWWAFHLLNWLRRDAPIATLYYCLWGADLATWPLWLSHALLHFAVHHLAYYLGELLYAVKDTESSRTLTRTTVQLLKLIKPKGAIS